MNWVLEGSPTFQKLGMVLVNMKSDRWSRRPGSNKRCKEKHRGKKHKTVNLSANAAVGPLQIIAVMWRPASVPPCILSNFAVTRPKCHWH